MLMNASWIRAEQTRNAATILDLSFAPAKKGINRKTAPKLTEIVVEAEQK